jgi:hypothetical protein
MLYNFKALHSDICSILPSLCDCVANFLLGNTRDISGFRKNFRIAAARIVSFFDFFV